MRSRTPPRGRRDGYIQKCVDLRATPCNKDGAHDRRGGTCAFITKRYGRLGTGIPGGRFAFCEMG